MGEGRVEFVTTDGGLTQIIVPISGWHTETIPYDRALARKADPALIAEARADYPVDGSPQQVPFTAPLSAL